MRKIGGEGMLYIYKASAGSGKTHKLTGEYIKLLFSQPNAFRHILAVTFTNKATDEMKQRILQELHLLSEQGAHSDYMGMIKEFTGKDEDWIRGEAKQILISILHDYTSFRVSTIDKFFQLVMRSFARELGRMATYNVELDKDSVLATAVDRMFSDLDHPQNSKLLEWLIEYSLDAVDKGDSWNVRGEILKLGGEIFSEEFKLAWERCGKDASSVSVEVVSGFKRMLRRRVAGFEKEALSLGKEAVDCIARFGLEFTDFKGKGRTPFNYLLTLANPVAGEVVPPPSDNFIQLEGNIENWYTGKTCPPAIDAVYEVLNALLGNILDLFDRQYSGYATAMAVLQNINVMGILNDIHSRVVEYCREKNIILLSESTELLGRIIDGNDTPFIYEKIGARLDNYMLDEFQDTSMMQWRNFYPLLKESLSQGFNNLIVGDVKQSIYRWRGSDWKILNENIYRQFRRDELVDLPLRCNYRSGANIVEFNNSFFDYCPKTAGAIYGEGSGTIEQIYSDFRQDIPNGKRENPGCVEVNFISNEESKFDDNVLELLPGKIGELLEGGYSLKDIAVLVRTGKQGNAVADCLISAGYEIISSDSLYISSCAAVRKVVNVLEQIDNPGSGQLKVLKLFCTVPQTGEMERYSLYQLCESIIRDTLSGEERRNVAYLQAFLDLVLDFTSNKGTNISQFLRWWKESGVKCTISAPEDMDAVRIMTIHKSKGLGFDVVIVPFLKESLDHHSSVAPDLWCIYDGYPVPVKYGKGLSSTSFADKYNDERLCAFVDSLNTAYVAFTRPKRELHIFAPIPKTKEKGYRTPSSVSDILFAYYLKYKDEYGWDGKIKYGTSGNVSKENVTSGKFAIDGAFGIPIDSSRARTVADGGTLGEGESIREHGIAMHYVFSMIDYQESAANAVDRACAEGVASCSKEQLLEMVLDRMLQVKEYGWFSKEWKILNECSILTPDGRERRPDRVMIKGDEAVVVDYKFGAYSADNVSQHNGYKKQVSRYMELLTRMGFKNVKGYLWYISANEVISV